MLNINNYLKYCTYMCFIFSIYSDPAPGPSNIPSPKRRKKSPVQTQSTLEHFRPLGSNKHNQITSALTYFIATEMMPYSIVEKAGFKYFVSCLQSTTTVSDAAQETYFYSQNSPTIFRN